MRRTRKNIFVYGEELTLPAASLEKFDQFEQWLTAELNLLERRFVPHMRATAGRSTRHDPTPTSQA